MSRIRFAVAMSLDGYIAGPKGEADWIVMDPDMDFGALVAQFDTLLVGRRTFETMVRTRRTTMPGMRTIVLSSTLRQADHPDVTIVSDNTEQFVTALRSEATKDVWLFGGGELFRRLLGAGLVDTVEVAIEPVVLGGGVPFLPSPTDRKQLQLTTHRVYRTGIIRAEYNVLKAAV